jgi:hypothetical protein
MFFNVNKLKPNLKMAVHRIGIVKNKKANAALAQRREVARLLADGKEEKARIRVSSGGSSSELKELHAVDDLVCCCWWCRWRGSSATTLRWRATRSSSCCASSWPSGRCVRANEDSAGAHRY